MGKQTEAMKLALEALENHSGNYKLSKSECVTHNAAIDALREALAEQPAQQEPVAWIVEDQSGERLEWVSDAHSCHGIPTFPLYTSPPAQKEPVATLWQHGETGRTRITMPGDITDCDARWFKAADLYTSPPVQRTWVGLTEWQPIEMTDEDMYHYTNWISKR